MNPTQRILRKLLDASEDKPMSSKDDWSVPWPDGSWLTWNDETESWDKQEGPPEGETKGAKPPVETPAAKAKAAPKATAGSKAEPTAKAGGGGSTPKKKVTSKKTPVKHTPKTTTARRASQPAESLGDTPPARIDTSTAASATASSAWRPMADRSDRVVKQVRSVPVSPARDSRPLAPAAPAGKALARHRDRDRDLSLLPVIAGGCVTGVAAGYLLAFLIR